MKKLISVIIIGMNLLSVFAKPVSLSYTIDNETMETIVTTTYEDDDSDLIESKTWIKDFPMARYMEYYFGEKNEEKISYSKYYNYNLQTKKYEKVESYYREDSDIQKSYSIPTIINNKYCIVATFEYKTINEDNISKVITVFTENYKPLNKTIYYNDNIDEIYEYIEYLENEECPSYIKHEYKNDKESRIALENYYLYPEYPFANRLPYKQIVYYENQYQGLEKKIITQNSDGTYFVELFQSSQKKNPLFLFSREVVKCNKNGIEIYAEQYYDYQLYGNKAYKIEVIFDEAGEVNDVHYFDKDGNEISESELEF